MEEMLESCKIIGQAIENLPAGPVNVDVESKVVLPNQTVGLSQHRRVDPAFRADYDQSAMANRRWMKCMPPRITQRRTGLLHRRRRQRRRLSRTDAAAVVHPFRHIPVFDRRPSVERRGGRAGQSEHHRGGVGPMSVLSEELRQKILAYLPRYPSKQAVTLPASAFGAG